jgi:hypothetical protein
MVYYYTVRIAIINELFHNVARNESVEEKEVERRRKSAETGGGRSVTLPFDSPRGARDANDDVTRRYVSVYVSHGPVMIVS